VKKNRPSQNLENIDKKIFKTLTLLKTREFDKALSILNVILNQMNLIQKFGARVAKLVALMGLKKYDQVNEEIKFSEQILNQMSNVKNFLNKL